MEFASAIAMTFGLLGCDPLADLARFPPHGYAVDQKKFASVYRENIRQVCQRANYTRMIAGFELDPLMYASPLNLNSPQRRQQIEMLIEAEFCYDCWDDLADATSQTTGDWFRRRAMYRLQERLGPSAYLAGQMPPAAPYWRFTGSGLASDP